jgi:hypothetical protein
LIFILICESRLIICFYVQLPDKCDYYRWQRAYFLKLIDADVIQMFVEGRGEEEEAESSGRGGGARNLQQQKHPIEAKVEQMMNVVMGLTALAIAFMCVGVGFMLKK